MEIHTIFTMLNLCKIYLTFSIINPIKGEFYANNH